jgi:short-subunit dehydrogenase
MARTRPPIDGGTILITGASAGIGEALARALAPRAGALVLVARRVDRLEALGAELAGRHPGLAVHAIGCDLARLDEVDGLLAELARRSIAVDVLVNNAGLGHDRLFDRAAWPALEQLLRVNVVALARLSHALVGPMVERGRGGVLNVGSGAGFTVFPGGATYIGSKHFVYGFTEALRLDLDGTGVAVAQVCPGPVATEFGAAASGGRGPGARAGLRPPAGLRISADDCAREAVAGFARGRAAIIPGRRFRALMALARTVAPHGVQRRALAPTARRMRDRGRAAQPRTPR